MKLYFILCLVFLELDRFKNFSDFSFFFGGIHHALKNQKSDDFFYLLA